MAKGSDLTAEEAASLLTEVTGETYRLIGRLTGGENGAHKFVGPDGRALVVKWDESPRSLALRGEAVALSERLRTKADWPVPMQSVVDAQGIRFVIQEFMPGATCDELDDNVVMQLLDLHDRRLDLAEPGDPVHWPKALIKTLTVGGEKYCLHSSLRDHDQCTRSLIGRIEKFGGSIDELAMTGNDIVHWDLHPGNLLIDGGSLVAIVDTDFAVVGDAHFDLVTLALNSLRIPCSPRVKSLLSSVAFEELDDVRTQTYLAHHFVRYLDWTISKHRSDEIEFWLKCAEEMLRI